MDPCIIGGESFRRRLTLVPSAAVWEQASGVQMERVQTDLAALKKQGDELQKQCGETTATLKSINDSLKGLSNWVPHVDDTIKGIQQNLETMGSRLEFFWLIGHQRQGCAHQW